MRTRAVLLALVFAGGPSSQPATAREFPGLSTGGPTGLILVPSGYVLPHAAYAVGLHRGAVKAAAGLLGILEAGGVLPDLYDDPNRDDWRHGTVGYVKVGGSPGADRGWVPSLAAGAENSIGRSAESYWAVASWSAVILTWPVEASVGAGTGRFGRAAFAGFGLIPSTFFGQTLKFVGELTAAQAALGARFALSRKLRLDAALLLDVSRHHTGPSGHPWGVRVDRGTLGASQTGSIRFDWLFPRPKGDESESGGGEVR